jgi:1-deoxy-D-xylulose-5-phosphate reductoisomerase
MAWPDRVPGVAAACNWTAPATWDFAPLDADAFPAVALARRAGTFGRTAPAVFNAANEVCVDAFLHRSLPFLGIVDSVKTVLDEHLEEPDAGQELTLASVLAADAWARERATAVVAS